MGVGKPTTASPLPIRAAKPEDYEAMVDVWMRAGLRVSRKGRESKTAFLRQLARFPTMYLVATDADHIVGVVLGSHDGRKGWINRLAVLPEYQRRGIALALAAACDTAIRADGIEIVAALVEVDNDPSAALLERLGFAADIPVTYYRKRAHPDV